MIFFNQIKTLSELSQNLARKQTISTGATYLKSRLPVCSFANIPP